MKDKIKKHLKRSFITGVIFLGILFVIGIFVDEAPKPAENAPIVQAEPEQPEVQKEEKQGVLGPESFGGDVVGKWLIQNHTPAGVINMERVLVITRNPAQLIWGDDGEWTAMPAIEGQNDTFVGRETYERLGDQAEVYWIYDGKNLTYGAGVEGAQKPLDPKYNTIKPIKQVAQPSGSKAPPTVRELSYSVYDESVYDAGVKTQVTLKLIVEEEQVTGENATALLKQVYEETSKRTGFKYHEHPTNIYIYLFGSEQDAEKGGLTWLAMLDKNASSGPNIQAKNEMAEALKEAQN